MVAPPAWAIRASLRSLGESAVVANRWRNLFCPPVDDRADKVLSTPLPVLFAKYPSASAPVNNPSPGTCPVNAPVTCAPRIPEPAIFGSTTLLARPVTAALGSPATFDVSSPALPTPPAIFEPINADPLIAFLVPDAASLAGIDATSDALSKPLANFSAPRLVLAIALDNCTSLGDRAANAPAFAPVATAFAPRDPPLAINPAPGTSKVGSTKFAPKLTKSLPSSS